MLLVVVPCPDLPAQPSGTYCVNHAGGLWQCSTSGTHATQRRATTAHLSLFRISVPGFPPPRLQPYGNRGCLGLQPIPGGRCSKQVHSLHTQNKPPRSSPTINNTGGRWRHATDMLNLWRRLHLLTLPPGSRMLHERQPEGEYHVRLLRFDAPWGKGSRQGILLLTPRAGARRGLPSPVLPNFDPDIGSYIEDSGDSQLILGMPNPSIVVQLNTVYLPENRNE